MTKQWTVHPHRTSPHQDRPIGLLDGTTLFPEAALPSGFRSSPNWADFETLSSAHGYYWVAPAGLGAVPPSNAYEEIFKSSHFLENELE